MAAVTNAAGRRIAVASGKGGTGKTTIATSLALGLAEIVQPPPLFLDCDVEAPNAHLFLKPALNRKQDVAVLIPCVDEALCTHCGKCADVCEFSAIFSYPSGVLVFPPLCHGCGSCTLVCPEHAIRETANVMGVLEAGAALGGISFARGVMNVGEPMAVPVIRALMKWVKPQAGQTVIVDAAPGTSCPVVEAVRGSDFLLLVTEPTPFGLHDLRLAAEVARELHMPAGVIINRDGIGDSQVDDFCAAQGLPILMRVPFDRAIAEGVARGQTLSVIKPAYRQRFIELFAQIDALSREAVL